MKIARNLEELARHRASLEGRRVALVATMGALHEGHRALIEAAKRNGETVCASIFVNPLQFGPAEDFSKYPRDEASDLRILEAAGCALAWLPEVTEMYPEDAATVISVSGPAVGFEGAARPGHFKGVATVVAKLLGQVRPDAAYFGEKDWQQLQVVRRMSRDLHFATEIVPVPTVRDGDGLALSSRNRFLTPEQRALAPMLHRVLVEVAEEASAERLEAGRAALGEAGFSLEYMALVDGESLRPVAAKRPGARLIAAARLGAVRLLDNVAAG
jgi:pantoate--beta-alanine ligase